jgi:RNA polymerase sigma factor (sigma-70 family)
MPPTRFPALAAQIRAVVHAPVERPQTDGELLASFVADRDPRAFALLVRRHGPMVLAACRRITGHAHDAEDAFQAVFLTLARRAGDVAQPEAAGNWLYGVAVRTARRARAVAARRSTREAPTDPLPDLGRPDPDPVPTDARAILDEELARLPDKYRTPVVLCDLGREPQAALARRLGVPVGTVYSRLATARALLGERLRKRGVGPPAVGLSALGAVAVSPRLLQAATGLATSGSIPPAVAGLVNGAFRTMYFRKLILGATLLALLGAACGALPQILAHEPSKPSPVRLGRPGRSADEKAAPVAAKPAGPGTLLLVGEGGKLVALSPEGKEKKGLNTPDDTYSARQARLSPDGKWAAFVIQDERRTGPDVKLDDPWPYKVVIRKLGATEAKVVDFTGFGVDLTWAPDGKRLAVTKADKGQRGATVLLDPESGKTDPLALPDGVRALDWHRDGKTFLVLYRKDKTYRLGLAEKGEAEVRELAQLKVRSVFGVVARFSPDGKKVLFTDADPEQKDAHKWHRSSQPHVLDVASKKREPLAEFPENAQCTSVAWAPDGKRVAYTWAQLHPNLLKNDHISIDDDKVETEGFLIVADADGRNQKTVASGKSEYAINPILTSIDWR